MNMNTSVCTETCKCTNFVAHCIPKVICGDFTQQITPTKIKANVKESNSKKYLRFKGAVEISYDASKRGEAKPSYWY